jgi:hypothetical protein
LNKFFGITLMVLALAIAIVPAFTDCQSQGKSLTTSTGKTVPMKCHWTGIAEIGVGVPLIGVGAMMVANKRKGNLFNLGIMGSILGIFAILFSNTLIGVCPTTTMICHTVMRPALTAFGSLAIVVSLGMIIQSRRMKEL